MTFKRAIVTAVGPLRIMIDGDTVAIPFTPKSFVDPSTLAVDDIVGVDLSGNRLWVLGRDGGLNPASTTARGPVELATSAETITGTDTGRAVTPEALAAALADAGVRAALGIPFAMAAGIVADVSLDPNGFADTTVTLPSSRFSVAPVVVPGNVGASRSTEVMVTSVTTTSFIVRRDSASSLTRTVGVSWTATQMTSGSATG